VCLTFAGRKTEFYSEESLEHRGNAFGTRGDAAAGPTTVARESAVQEKRMESPLIAFSAHEWGLGPRIIVGEENSDSQAEAACSDLRRVGARDPAVERQVVEARVGSPRWQAEAGFESRLAAHSWHLPYWQQ